VVSSPILNQRRADRERSSIEEVLVIEDEEQLQPTVKAEETTRKLKSKEDLPQSVPGFRLLQKLGEGGMGEVFEAEQLEPVRRKVALKLIKRGMESKEVLARFDAERQALALMSHPNIAQVYDAGTTEDGRPYFVMEFIQGVPVTQYCDTNRLTTEERLELFTQICDGVQHAHHKGVIHRDIKPSNVLVKIQDSKPVPKIIDFGVAKAVAQRLTEQSVFTAIGEFIGTPEYMSPEQAEMTELDVDTRTDVYSLGVVLYELLVGAPPFDARELRQAGFSEMRRRIREDEPPRPSLRLSGLGEASTTAAEKRRSEPSTLARQLHGDLDWITMKALEKDRTRRYDSPGELAADISRHLRDEPVLAGPPSATYRVKKFVRRHTLGVAAGAFMVLALIVGVAGIALGLVRAREAERQASQEAETATQISDFLIGLFEVSDPSEAKGETITAREILDEGAEKIRSELADQPLVQARLMMTMGNVYQSLALYKSAAPLLEEALEINERHLEPDDPRIASNLNNLALLYKEQGMYAEAEPLYQRALPIWEEALGPDHPDLASSLDNLANLYSDKGKYEEAVLLSERALAIREKSFGPDHPETAVSLNNLTILYRVLGRLADAEPLALRALEIREKALGPDHPELASSLANLAKLRAEQGKYAEAVPYYQRALAIMEKALGPGHPDLAVSLNDLANLYLAQAKYTEAEPLLRRGLEIREKALGPDHPAIGSNLDNLANLVSSQGRYAEAESLYRRGLAITEKAVGPDHPNVGVGLHNLATACTNQGKYAEAEPLHRRSLAIFENAFGSDHGFVSQSVESLAILHAMQKEFAEAEPLFERALEINEKILGPDHPRVASSVGNLANVYADLGKYAEAEPLFRRALEISEEALGPDHPGVAYWLHNLGFFYVEHEKHAEAEPLLLRALEIREETLGPDHPEIAVTLHTLGNMYGDQGRFSEADPRFQRAITIREKSLGPNHPQLLELYSDYATFLRTTGRTDEAAELEARVDAAREERKIG
jgi:serine/threonine protein kinase/tetratricopeptide (TPR) repeat protein